MKKLAALLFTLALAFSLSMPVSAQGAGSSDPAPKAEKKHSKKMHKASTKTKKTKKSKKEKKSDEAPKS